jgi:extradiol dioxygenase family protein
MQTMGEITMNVNDKELLISKMYTLLTENWMEISKKFEQKEISFEEYNKLNFPVGAIEKISKTIRDFKGDE